jgi:hypothetical protein
VISTCRASFVHAIHPQTDTGDKNQSLYNLFAAYLHTVPLKELIASVERARRDAQLKYVVIYVMCPHDAEKRAISVLEIYEGGGKEKVSNGRAIVRTNSFLDHVNGFNTVAPFLLSHANRSLYRIA